MTNKIKNYWTAKNFPLVIILSLYVALFFTINPITLPVTQIAYSAEIQENLYVQELEERAVQKYLDNFDDDMKKAMTQVLLEEQIKLQQAAQELPDTDFSHLQDVVNAMQ